jgi:acetyl-CoA acetyltransferase
MVGRRAAEAAFAMAGLGPDDVDVCEFYDPFSFEIIRQFEAFGFCKEGEGNDFVLDGIIEPGGRYPITTDGGLMSFSHGGAMVQLLQRAIRGVQQVRGECATRQVDGADVALCTGGGAGALFTDVLLLGKDAA